MKKKIYTFSLVLFAFLFALYFVWSLAANIQKEALKQHLSNEWAVTLSEEKITTDGFPFKFGIKVSNFQSQLNNTPVKLEFLKLEIIRLIYNFSDFILFLEKPMVTSMYYPKFNSSSNKLKASISDRPFSGKFKLITEQENWQLSDHRNTKILEATEVIFALKDADQMNLDFYFQADNFGVSILDKIYKKDRDKPNKLILKGSILNSVIRSREGPYKPIKLENIMLEKLDMNIGFFKLSCNDMVALNLFKLTTKEGVACLLKLSPKNISKIKTDNQLIQSIIDIVNLLLIINNPTSTAEQQAIPIKLSLDKGLFYINAIPIYQFPKQY